MRGNPTEPEKRLWHALRGKRFQGFKFRRQAVLGARIVDFFCPAKGLVIEVDGDSHDRVLDLKRDERMMESTGFAVVRFTNEDVMRNMEGVLIMLETALARQADRWPGRSLHHPPAPSSEEEGE